MGATRKASSRRARGILSVALIGLLAVGGGTALVIAGADAAYATNPLTNDIPENTPISHSPFLFQGTADPGDPITVDSGGFGPDCNTVADGLGNWSCNVVFTTSTDVTVVTASRPDDGTPAQDSEGWEYPIALPVIINETQAGQVLTNDPAAAVTGSGAWPGAGMIVLINGSPCTGPVAGPGGTWSCTYSGPALGDGSYSLSASQDVGLATSDVTNSNYVLDTTTFIPSFASPFDSGLPPGSTQTSDTTPTVSGGAGDAEPFGTVTVYASDFGVAPPAHPNGGPGNFWCSGVADGTGAWSCTGAALTVNHYWDFGATQVDQAGNATGSPDDEFDIHILPPPAAPVVFSPSIGFGELPPVQAFGSVDAATTAVRVSEGGSDLCGPIAPAALSFTVNGGPCPGGVPLSPGTHTLDFTAYDVYGTASAVTQITGVESWAQPTIVTPAPGYHSSVSTLNITGTAPIGSDLSVRLDGFSICNLLPATTSWNCPTPLLSVAGHAIDVDYTDPWGTPSATINRPFTIVGTLSAPGVSAPVNGLTTTDKTVHVAMVNEPEGAAWIREGSTHLCASTPLVTGTFSCDTIQLAVGVHHLEIAQTDQYGVLSGIAHRTVTILPTPNLPLTMKTFGFAFQVLNPDGSPIDENGLGTGDMVTIEATGVPPGARLITEIHSTPIELGSQLVGQTGVMRLTTAVPVVPPGAHEIVVTATGPGYFPAAFSEPFTVHGLKVIPPADDIDETGDTHEEKILGTPEDATGTGTGTGGGSGGTNQHGFTDPTIFGSSVDTPFDATAHAFALSPAGIVLSGSIAIAFLLLVGFPAELLESTIRSNYDRAFGWLARLRRRVGRMLAPVARLLANPWVGAGLTILAASFLLGFADPDFGFNGASVRLMLAMMIAVVVINIGISLIVMRVARRAFDVAAVLKPMPAALAIVAVSVLVSRLAGISPGFLFGVVLGVAYARELKLRDEARLGVLGVGLTIAAGLLAWLGYGLASTASGPGFFNNLIIEALAAITLEALGTLVIALLPIEFLDGRTIFRWSKPAWLGLYAITLLVFLFVVVPMSDNWGTMSAPIFGWGTLFAVFAAVAIVTWAIFRRRSRAATPSSPEAARPRQRVRR